jgi:hypothetical protein
MGSWCGRRDPVPQGLNRDRFRPCLLRTSPYQGAAVYVRCRCPVSKPHREIHGQQI